MGTNTASTRWFFNDWLSDDGLKLCSFAAKGLWIDLLCYAGRNHGKDYGYVIINGKVADEKLIAQTLKASPTEVRALLGELEINRVFSRDRRGAIYNRRMLKEQKAKRNGKLGGRSKSLENKDSAVYLNPSLGKEVLGNEVLGNESEDCKRPTKFPVDWKLDEGRKRAISIGLMNGYTREETAHVFSQFRAHYIANGQMRVDWFAQWEFWLLEDMTRNGRRPNGGANGKATNGSSRHGFSTLALKLAREAREEG